MEHEDFPANIEVRVRGVSVVRGKLKGGFL